MARTTKILGFSVPPEVAEEFEAVAQSERRTKSELFREMFRLYQRYRSRQTEYDEAWVRHMIHEANEDSLSEDELLRKSQALASYGAQQAKALGYEPLDDEGIERIMVETEELLAWSDRLVNRLGHGQEAVRRRARGMDRAEGSGTIPSHRAVTNADSKTR